MIIDEHKLDLVDAAIRDILFLFRDLIMDNLGFGHGANTGQFDPFLFSIVEGMEGEGVAIDIDTKLLMSGSGIAMLCAISDAWDEGDPETVQSCQYFKRVRKVLNDGGFVDIPRLRKALTLGLSDEEAFREMLPDVYEEYVVGYFRELCRAA